MVDALVIEKLLKIRKPLSIRNWIAISYAFCAKIVKLQEETLNFFL